MTRGGKPGWFWERREACRCEAGSCSTTHAICTQATRITEACRGKGGGGYQDPHHGKQIFASTFIPGHFGNQRTMWSAQMLFLTANATWEQARPSLQQGCTTCRTSGVYLLDFAVLHGRPGVQPGREGGHTTVLLPYVSLIPRFEQHHILQDSSTALAR